MWLEENDQNNRLLVLEKALSVEYFINQFLGQLLGIECEDSKTLGYKSTSLSLNQKVLILLDLKIIEPTEKEKIEKFMYVRNQFMHNLNISCFEKCFEIDKGVKNWFDNKYPSKMNNKSIEQKYREAFLSLSYDVDEIISKKLLFSVLRKIKQDSTNSNELKIKYCLEEIYTEIFETLPASLECFINKGNPIENIPRFVNELKAKFNNELLNKLKGNE